MAHDLYNPLDALRTPIVMNCCLNHSIERNAKHAQGNVQIYPLAALRNGQGQISRSNSCNYLHLDLSLKLASWQ